VIGRRPAGRRRGNLVTTGTWLAVSGGDRKGLRPRRPRRRPGDAQHHLPTGAL